LFRNELACVEDLLELQGSSGRTRILYATVVKVTEYEE
jgi:hypothetical protein